MRGKGHKKFTGYYATRITPAYAGKSSHTITPYFKHWDHPRLCGEKLNDFKTYSIDEGSPPPMRGKVHWKQLDILPDRITPAYAGKSPFFFYIPVYGQDHPRLCGEKMTVI